MSVICYETKRFADICRTLILMPNLEYVFGNPENLTAAKKIFCLELHWANVRASNERYEENDVPDAKLPAGEQYGNLVALYKALQGVHYNITGDDIAFRLEKLMEHVAMSIIEELPEYEKAEW